MFIIGRKQWCEDDKEVRTGKAELKLKAKALLAETGGGTGNLRVPQLDLLLKWYVCR